MKQCPFCGTKWQGNGPCPGCGLEPEVPRDDAMFRPPEDGEKHSQETPPEFEVEELLRWEPSDSDAGEAEEDSPEEKEEPFPEEGEEEEALTPHRRWKRWQKLTMAVVAVVVVAALVVRLWPQSPALPTKSTFFVQNNTLMALTAGGEPQKFAPYVESMEYDMYTSPDQKSVMWLDRQDLTFYVQSMEGEAVPLEKGLTAYPKFSEDSRYLYYSVGDGNDEILYRYELATGQKQKVGPGTSDSLWFGDSLLAVNNSDSSSLAIYDANTLEQQWTNQAPLSVAGFDNGKLYYLEQVEPYYSYRLCCWQNGQVNVLLEDVAQCVPTDGALYFMCRTGEEVPLTDLMDNDAGTDGEEILEKLEDQTVRTPNFSLYCLQDGALTLLGKNLSVYYFGTDMDATLASVLTYQPVRETRFSLQRMMGIYGDDQESVVNNLKNYVSTIWPHESSLQYLVKDGKLFSLPEDVPQDPRYIQTAGDWMCFYHYTDIAAERGLWLGKIQGDKVVSQGFYPVTDINQFLLTPEGKVYYWSGQGNQFVGAVYENGVPLVTNVNLQNVQTTDDGALYFLSGSAAFWTLNRIADGQLETVAQNIEDFSAYTRDYAVCLQNREDQTGYDLLACEGGGQPRVVAQQVDALLQPEKNRMQIVHSSTVGGVSGYEYVTTDAVG